MNAATTGPSRLTQHRVQEIIEAFRSAYEAHDIDGMLALFADDAVFVAAVGAFHGKEAIRRFLAWDAALSPTARIKDVGVGIIVHGRTVTWEREIRLSYRDVPYGEESLAIIELDENGLIRRFRSYYDKLAVLDQITSRLPGVYGWVTRVIVRFLLAQGHKGLDLTR